ncbi:MULTISPECIES: hypothetical protein [Calothrix]|uniref:Alpha/beta hydrolase n=2 Tax=Calothrix TaxID=1186 RepID=A0ABR8A5H5_9CYAN|nr:MULTISPECIES: hypothetical protein [Calothrix]MBD2195231.1 hypothetical protein [Calothrix parietina FACHB-288]MBD2223798.1 hypothetical protein [Calothrix anomala FACHB-343]
MNIIICPGMHERELTESFISGCLNLNSDSLTTNKSVNILVYPQQGVLTISPLHILQFLHNCLGDKLESPVIFISFSAGVVGAMLAAHSWQLLGGKVTAFIAIDGWGVPLWGDFPIHRMSHDYFTHWSSSLLGSGKYNFYAQPAVEHLSIWRSPQTIQGFAVKPTEEFYPKSDRISAAEFIHLLLRQYESK